MSGGGGKRREINRPPEDTIIPDLENAPDIEFKKPWSEWEMGVVRRYYGRKTNEAIGKALDRTPQAVQNKAQNMGLKKSEVRE